VAAIAATVEAELPSAWVYASGAEAAVVACPAGCPPREAAGAALLDPAGVAGLARGRRAQRPSTDDDLRLEWSAPQEARRTFAGSRKANLAFLEGEP
jgi:hypothetical protein